MKAIPVFFAVFAAIVISVFIFAPERLPAGIGVTPIPVEAAVRPSLFGQGQVAELKNTSSKSLQNVKVILRNINGDVIKSLQQESWSSGETMSLGWMEGWQITKQTQLKVMASGYYPQTWKY